MTKSKNTGMRELNAILKNMDDLLQSLDEMGAQVAATHVNAGIESFCKQFEIKRYPSNSEEFKGA